MCSVSKDNKLTASPGGTLVAAHFILPLGPYKEGVDIACISQGKEFLGQEARGVFLYYFPLYFSDRISH